MSWHGYFGDAGGLFGYPSQQEAVANYFGGIQNQMANAYNHQAAFLASSNNQSIQDLLSARPGGVVRVCSPSSVQFLPRPEASADCKGCGAPLKSYIHHCEYCRRPT